MVSSYQMSLVAKHGGQIIAEMRPSDLVERYLMGVPARTNEHQQNTQELAATSSPLLLTANTNTNSSTLVSAGYNQNPLGDQLYFGIPGPKLVFESDLNGGVGVKFGVTTEGNEKQRFTDHVKEYGGFVLLDCLQCKNARLVETKLKHMTLLQSRRLYGKTDMKANRDTELVLVKDQEDYNILIQIARDFVTEIDLQCKDQVEIMLAQERNRFEQEKTKQLELQLEILRLQQSSTTTTTNDTDVIMTDAYNPQPQMAAAVSAESATASEQHLQHLQLPRRAYTSANPIPVLRDPMVDLYECYEHWLQIREYYYCVKQPPWKKQFGNQAAKHKLRYSRMRPFLRYMDVHGNTPERTQYLLEQLEDIRLQFDVTPTCFVKQCFYVLCRPSPSVEDHAPIKRHELIGAMQMRRLPTVE